MIEEAGVVGEKKKRSAADTLGRRTVRFDWSRALADDGEFSAKCLPCDAVDAWACEITRKMAVKNSTTFDKSYIRKLRLLARSVGCWPFIILRCVILT